MKPVRKEEAMYRQMLHMQKDMLDRTATLVTDYQEGISRLWADALDQTRRFQDQGRQVWKEVSDWHRESGKIWHAGLREGMDLMARTVESLSVAPAGETAKEQSGKGGESPRANTGNKKPQSGQKKSARAQSAGSSGQKAGSGKAASSGGSASSGKKDQSGESRKGGAGQDS
jgi:hypothetical protein